MDHLGHVSSSSMLKCSLHFGKRITSFILSLILLAHVEARIKSLSRDKRIEVPAIAAAELDVQKSFTIIFDLLQLDHPSVNISVFFSFISCMTNMIRSGCEMKAA